MQHIRMSISVTNYNYYNKQHLTAFSLTKYFFTPEEKNPGHILFDVLSQQAGCVGYSAGAGKLNPGILQSASVTDNPDALRSGNQSRQNEGGTIVSIYTA